MDTGSAASGAIWRQAPREWTTISCWSCCCFSPYRGRIPTRRRTGWSPVYVRQVVENALYAGASGIILAHNHPSGVALPSAEDRMVTHQVMEALEPLGIRLIDHIVVADNDFVSMAESKLM